MPAVEEEEDEVEHQMRGVVGSNKSKGQGMAVGEGSDSPVLADCLLPCTRSIDAPTYTHLHPQELDEDDQMKRPRPPPLLQLDKTAPFLAAPVPTANDDAASCPPSSLPAAAAASILVNGPLCQGPRGWASVASQDGQVRVYDMAAFLSLSRTKKKKEERPLMLVHVLRPGGGAQGQLLHHAWATTAPSTTTKSKNIMGDAQDSYLATLHRSGVVVHRLAAASAATAPPTPSAVLRPCSEARCLALLVLPRADDHDAQDQVLVAIGGSFGLELHQLPLDECRPPRRLLPGASVSLLQFSPDGRFLALACLDGRIGVLEVDDLAKQDHEITFHSNRNSGSSWTCTVVRGERATCLSFSSSSHRLAVTCADGNTLLFRPSSSSSSSSSWQPCPAFHTSLRTASRSVSTSSVSSSLGGVSPLPCWCALGWSPGDRFLAVSLPGSQPRLMVLDGQSGATLLHVSLPRAWQGMCVSGETVLGVDYVGGLVTYRWQGGGRRKEEEEGGALLLARTASASVWRRARQEEEEEEDEDETLTLVWKKVEEEEEMVLEAPFVARHACASWREEQIVSFSHPEEEEKESRQRRRQGWAVLGKKHVGIAFPELLYVHGEGQGEEWQAWPVGGKKGGGMRLQAAAFVESKKEEEEEEKRVKILALLSHEKEEEEREEVFCLRLLQGPDADASPLTVLPWPANREPSSSSSSWRWAMLTNSTRFVLLGWQQAPPAEGEGEGERGDRGGPNRRLYVWRGDTTPPTTKEGEGGGGGGPTLSPQAPLCVEVPCPSCLWPAALRVRKEGALRVSFWEVKEEEEEEEGKRSDRCWTLEIGGEEEKDEEEGEEEEDGSPAYAWRVACQKKTARAGEDVLSSSQ